MGDQYSTLIREKNISDILSYITDISYTRKIYILNKLLDKYSVEVLNVSLEIYFAEYVKLNRVDNNRILNTLKGICERKSK